MNLKDFYYDLPQELIAQHPAEKRDQSRLMFLDKNTGAIRHGTFRDILGCFVPGDCLILNDSRVIPARLFAKRIPDNAEIEVFLLRPLDNSNTWECLVKPGKKMKKNTRINVNGIQGEVTEVFESGNRAVHFNFDGDFKDKLKEIGQIPLPPYIHEEQQDYGRYQTVYARYDGSVAAPTAGLHFTEELLDELRNNGVEIGFVTLHVGLGTFRPVKAEHIEDHKMHSEFFILPEKTAEIINKAKRDGHRVTAVGTTCTRTLETAGCRLGLTKDKFELREISGETDIFIYPPYEFKVIDRLITNFHLPESTLIMLVSALAGRENVLNAYKEAVKEKYRFFSFGDAMFIG